MNVNTETVQKIGTSLENTWVSVIEKQLDAREVSIADILTAMGMFNTRVGLRILDLAPGEEKDVLRAIQSSHKLAIKKIEEHLLKEIAKQES